MKKSRFKIVNMTAYIRAPYTMRICVPVDATQEAIEAEIDIVTENSTIHDWKLTEERRYIDIEIDGYSFSSIPNDSEAADTGFIEDLYQPRFEELNEEPRTDFSDGSDDLESDSARYRAEMRLRAQDESDTRDLY